MGCWKVPHDGFGIQPLSLITFINGVSIWKRICFIKCISLDKELQNVTEEVWKILTPKCNDKTG